MCMGYEPLFQVLSMALVATVAIIAVNIPYGLLYFLNLKGEGLLDRYLLQPKRKEATQWTRGQWWKAFWVTVTNYILVYVVTFLNGPITAYFRPDFFERDMLWSPVPGVAQWAIDMLRGVIVEDFVFYFLHRALHHYPVLYTSIHKMHHEYKAPFHLTAMYATVTEFFLVDIFPLMCGFLTASHWSTALGFVAYRLYLTCEAHSGYSFPWALDNILDSMGIHFFSGSKHHDAHHEKTHCNFSSNLYFWDWLLGTSEYSAAYKMAEQQRHEEEVGKQREGIQNMVSTAQQ